MTGAKSSFQSIQLHYCNHSKACWVMDVANLWHDGGFPCHCTVQRASCKWCDAQRAMRNRQFIGYTFGFWNAILGLRRRFWEGRLLNFVWTDNLFSGWARPGNIFLYGMGSENLFSYKHGKPQSTEAITRNSNVIECRSIR